MRSSGRNNDLLYLAISGLMLERATHFDKSIHVERYDEWLMKRLSARSFHTQFSVEHFSINLF
jgi:hypothetical protein